MMIRNKAKMMMIMINMRQNMNKTSLMIQLFRQKLESISKNILNKLKIMKMRYFNDNSKSFFKTLIFIF